MVPHPISESPNYHPPLHIATYNSQLYHLSKIAKIAKIVKPYHEVTDQKTYIERVYALSLYNMYKHYKSIYTKIAKIVEKVWTLPLIVKELKYRAKFCWSKQGNKVTLLKGGGKESIPNNEKGMDSSTSEIAKIVNVVTLLKQSNGKVKCT